VAQIVIFGGSGFGRELLQYVQDSSDLPIKGFIDDDPTKGAEIESITGMGMLGSLSGYQVQSSDRFLVSIGDPELRRAIALRLQERGAQFHTLVHPTAYVASTARLGPGCIIGPFATVGSFVRLEDHVLINLYGAAGHDTIIGPYSVFSPYAVANGGSRVGPGVFLGSHAVIAPNVNVGARCKIAAGSVVYRDVPEGSFASGNPAMISQLKPSTKESTAR
jgi:sugar O-acyltransferase (sialic acid O-acetyltransferase NeuD family)